MKKMKKILPVLISVVIMISVFAPMTSAWVGDLPQRCRNVCNGRTAICYNVTDKQTLFVNNPTRQIQVASNTKVLTACVASQYFDADDILTVGYEQSLLKYYASVAPVYNGQKYTFKNLLAAMLVPSGCDAAYAIAANTARKASGNYSMSSSAAISYFVSMMNQFCRDLGCTDSYWVNPDGQDEYGYYGAQHTTIQDYAKVAEYAINTPVIAEVVNNYYYCCYDEAGGYHEWATTNAMINPYSGVGYDGVVGIKTGTTNSAGSCLMLAVDENDKMLIIFVVGCSSTWERYTICQNLIDICEDYFVQQGDVDHNGKKDISDARNILRIALKLDPYADTYVCDYDLDGSITVQDARIALRTAIGLPRYE